MANSYVTYTGEGQGVTGTNDTFLISIDYLSTGHITVHISSGGSDTLKVSGTHYNIVGTSVIFTAGNIPPTLDGAGLEVTVKIIRDTPREKTDRLVDFEDGAVLTESDLDTAHLQLLYIAQEAFERDGTVIEVDKTYLGLDTADGLWDADDKRMKDLSAPTGAKDAANKTYVDTRAVSRTTDDGDYDASSKKITNVASPTLSGDAATKGWAESNFTTSSATSLNLDASDSKWNALYSGAKRAIKNVLDDTSDLSSVPTRDYVDSLALFGIAGNPTYLTTTLVDGQAAYTLVGFGPNTQVKSEMLVVSIDGVHQAPGADYTVLSTDVGGDAQISLTTTPTSVEAGFKIIVMNFGTGRVASTETLADGAVTTAKLADSAVTSVKIADGTIATADIADSQITSAKIADGTIATGDIADDAVTAAKLADDAVITDNIVNYAVTNPKIASNAITSTKLADDSVTTAKIADDAVTAAQIADNTVTFFKLNDTAGSGTTFHTGSGLSGTAPYILQVSNTGVLTLAPLAGEDLTDLGDAVAGLAISDFGTATSEVNMGDQFLTNVKTPTDTAHATTKAYVDSRQPGFITPEISTIDWNPTGPSPAALTHTHSLAVISDVIDNVRIKLYWMPVSEDCEAYEYYDITVGLAYLDGGGSVLSSDAQGVIYGTHLINFGHNLKQTRKQGSWVAATYDVWDTPTIAQLPTAWSYELTDIPAGTQSIQVSVSAEGSVHVGSGQSFDADDNVTLSVKTQLKGQILHQL